MALALALVLSTAAVGADKPESTAGTPGHVVQGPAAPHHIAEPANASRSTNFEIRWHTVSAGGGTATSADDDIQLRGSIGQPSASADHPASGPTYSHRGGFWVALATRGKAVADRLFRDRFEP